MTYIIYSETEFESDDGIIKKGEEINVIHGEKEDEPEIRQWLIGQYVLDGIDISYQIVENGKPVGKKKKLTNEIINQDD